jgi:hypothetical protein
MNAVVSEALYDIFLSHSPGADDDTVSMIRSAFAATGLKVFDSSQLDPGANFQDEIWNALAVSIAVVVVASPSTMNSAWTAVEIGAAQAWHKPVFVLQSAPTSVSVPPYLGRFQLLPVSRIEDVIQAIKNRSAPILSPAELDLLRDIYVEMNLPTDQLLGSPSQLTVVAQRFNKRNHSDVSGETLAHELIKMRKRGGLPRLKRQ